MQRAEPDSKNVDIISTAQTSVFDTKYPQITAEAI